MDHPTPLPVPASDQLAADGAHSRRRPRKLRSGGGDTSRDGRSTHDPASSQAAASGSTHQKKGSRRSRKKKPEPAAANIANIAETANIAAGPLPPAIYAAYYDASQLAEGFASGQLVRGVFRTSPKSRSDAYVSLDETPSAEAVRRYPLLADCGVGSGNDVYVCGDIDRNRAINGDVVAIRILNKAQSRASYRMHRIGDDRHHDRLRAQRRARLEHMASKLNSDSTSSLGTEADPKPKVPELFGAVVAILCPNDNRCFTGTIATDAPSVVKRHPAYASTLDPETLWFKPLNQALPLMALAASDVPRHLYASKSKRHCTVRLLRWDACAPVPTAGFVSDLGKRGSLDIETRLILEENGVCAEPFSPAVLRCLPQAPWSIPAREIRRRTDLRRACIFTIDPPTARDLDDAVSCETLPNGNVLIGVHIADVSYFVRPGTALDLEARRRATTTYMVQKAIPMLPAMLCENLCSLNPGVNRLAFSVMWEMDPSSATVLSTWFGRTVINSACKLSYDDAQL
ncbi:hypothetical protein LPJ75_005497, partial [Coemansia sp. RSA 2598]